MTALALELLQLGTRSASMSGSGYGCGVAGRNPPQLARRRPGRCGCSARPAAPRDGHGAASVTRTAAFRSMPGLHDLGRDDDATVLPRRRGDLVSISRARSYAAEPGVQQRARRPARRAAAW